MQFCEAYNSKINFLVQVILIPKVDCFLRELFLALMNVLLDNILYALYDGDDFVALFIKDPKNDIKH